MKFTLISLLGTLLLGGFLAGCAPTGNQFLGTPNAHNVVAGFWLGLWHGIVAPFVLVVSLFKNNLSIYEVHNSGGWYNFGYLLGVACFFRGSGNRSPSRK